MISPTWLAAARHGFWARCRGIGLGKAWLCLSVASLLFMNAWVELFPGTYDQYLQDYQPSFHALWALWLNTLALATCLYLAHSLASRSRRFPSLAILGGLLVLAALVDPTRRLITQFSPVFESVVVRRGMETKPLLLLIVTLGTSVGWLILRKPNFCHRGLRLLFSILSPLPLFLTVAVIKGIPLESPRLVPPLAATSARWPKAVVMIFDEWDYEYTFVQRPKQIHLPEVDRFCKEYTTFTHCLPPAGVTIQSIASLITGAWWRTALPQPGGDLALKPLQESKPVLWSQTPDLFSTLAASGWRSHMIQWWHVFGAEYLNNRPGLTVSHYEAYPTWHEPREAYATFKGSLVRQWTLIWRSYRAFSRVLTPLDLIPARIATIHQMRSELLQSIRPGDNDLVWAHLPYPHAPAVIRAETQTFLTAPDPKVSNLENMVLIDRTVGEVRRRMETAGIWDEALVILTSDHGQRQGTGDHLVPPSGRYTVETGLRVPLLIKFPGQREPFQYDSPTCNLALRHILEARAAGKLAGPRDLPALLPALPAHAQDLLLPPQAH